MSTEIRSMHRANDGLKEQNDRLLHLNERLMGETELLRQDILKLRQLLMSQQGGKPGNVYDNTYMPDLQAMQERLNKLQVSSEEKHRDYQHLEMELTKSRRRNQYSQT